jgi:hypothetical protein
VLVCLIDWPVRVMCNGFRVCLKRTPEVGNETITVIDCLDTRIRWPTQEHSAAAKERFHVILHVSKAVPNKGRNFGFPAEPRERSL